MHDLDERLLATLFENGEGDMPLFTQLPNLGEPAIANLSIQVIKLIKSHRNSPRHFSFEQMPRKIGIKDVCT